ncbi:hypothetical+protein [Methylocapsa aurea]|uniref:hypothetical protein n=1 Tax=Methylocapsa aurea TaxID=663610 RepID=UPI003D188EED
MRLGTGGNRSARAVVILAICLVLLRALGAFAVPSPPAGHVAEIAAALSCSAKDVASEDSSGSGRHLCRDCADCLARTHASTFDGPSVLSAAASRFYRPLAPPKRQMASRAVASSCGWTTSWSSRAPPSLT